ncbi:hypothetical protein Tco_0220047, partial [Tanacetum coccineum]
TRSQLEGYLKENKKVISDLKVKEEKDIDKMIEYTRNQSIQTIHMLAPKCATYNGRLTFANPRYLKKAQSEKPCLYEIPYDNSDLTNQCESKQALNVSAGTLLSTADQASVFMLMTFDHSRSSLGLHVKDV